MQGDTLLLDCFYRTTTRTGVVLVRIIFYIILSLFQLLHMQGGLATANEMCFSFPIYYPKVDSSTCLSTPTFNKFADFVREHVP